MVIYIMGESCTGKSTTENFLKKEFGARIFTGKAYRELAKNEDEAKKAFKGLLESKVNGTEIIICVLSEKENLGLVPGKCFQDSLYCRHWGD